MRLPVEVRRLGYRVAYRLLGFYWFVRRPTTRGVKCVLTHRQRVLLVRHTYGPAEWKLPGGTLRRNEPPLSGIGREMSEELGISPPAWIDLGTISGRLHHHHHVLRCFQAELAEPALKLDPGEIAEANWFGRHELPRGLGRYTETILALAAESTRDPAS